MIIVLLCIMKVIVILVSCCNLSNYIRLLITGRTDTGFYSLQTWYSHFHLATILEAFYNLSSERRAV